jgi:serine phosphatase RsbU (regulator of sigma subunit)
MSYAELSATEEFKKAGKISLTKIVVHTADKKDINCVVIPVTHDETVMVHIILQSKSPFDPAADSVAALACHLSAVVTAHIYKTIKTEITETGKKELMNLRHIQAMLFPKFENIEGFDVGNVLLPAQAMSGNFVDGFPLGDDVFQIVACSVTGHDTTAPFVGSAVRTIIRSSSAQDIKPSSLVDIVSQKISKIVSGVHYLVNVNVFQLNIKSRKMVISAFGPITALLYDAQRKKAFNLGDTEIGKELAKHSSYKDLSFSFHSGDALLYYTSSILTAEAEDGKSVYGYSMLFDRFVKNIDLPATDHVHTITQSIFEFSNFTPLKEDVILVKIRKQ